MEAEVSTKSQPPKHAIGVMPLGVEIQDVQGKILNVIRRDE